MKKIGYYIIGVFILISSSCKEETKNNLTNTQKNKKKEQIIIKNNNTINSTKDITELINKNKNFDHLFHSFSKKEFSIEELIDIVKQDLSYVKDIRQMPKSKQIDTATVKSRLLLTEINLKKMQFLLHKKTPDKDSIEKTLNTIVSNMNSTINQLTIYNYSFDEFSAILAIDSVQKAKHDSLKKILQKKAKPNMKQNIKHNIRPNIKSSDIKLKKIF